MARSSVNPRRLRPVVPDQLDLRDRPYRPVVSQAPPTELNSLRKHPLAPMDQGETSACTGFALAHVVNFLLRASGRDKTAAVSPYMLYSMARRYDDIPGTVADTGSSLRGALKGWYKHGACSQSLWTKLPMPPPKRDPAKDWWQDAALRPLGAYYRIDTRSVTDMHSALSEVGVIYASAICHGGWDEGYELTAKERKGWVIPRRAVGADDMGHAFVIVGFNARGFLVLNSWGPGWGDGGVGILEYDDWLTNAMDCWVAQLGVVTEHHLEVARAASLRTEEGHVVLTKSPVLRNREISPFIVDLGNNGELSTSGDFRTNVDDLRALATIHLPEARAKWKPGSDAIDVAIYAHGGLVGEDSAADTAARWVPALYNAQIFPVFLMWETDIWNTLKNRLTDVIFGEPKPTGGIGDAFAKWWDRRLEHNLAPLGSLFWDEMKQNAEYIGTNPKSGLRQLYSIGTESKNLAPGKVRLHLIGHSAGSIALSQLAPKLVSEGYTISSVNFMAPAVRLDVFERTVVPLLKKKKVGVYNQYHLLDEAEQRDTTCRKLLGYGRSLLYLVSESFEHGARTPILGMEKYFEPALSSAWQGLPIVRRTTRTGDTSSTSHGGFDDDPVTMQSVITAIRSSTT